MTYQTLKAGDIRQAGDQVQNVGLDPRSRKETFDGWCSTYLVGWPILPADLFHTQLRRPLP